MLKHYLIVWCIIQVSTLAYYYQRKVPEFHDTSCKSTFENQLSSENRKIVEVAINAARKAGEVVLGGLGKINLRQDVQSKIGTRDVVTEVDKQSQDIIKATILKAFPNHSFLGEEDIPPGIEASKAAIENFLQQEHLWIVDPIDGTTNFAHGIPLTGIIIAYAHRGETQMGLIYDPVHDELFTAWKGCGSYLNLEQRLSCCATSTLASSVILTGSPPNFQALDGCLRATQRLSPLVRTMRMFGSAATMLSYVAMGRATAYVETDLNAWDLAAGSLLIREAGGKVTDVWGQEYNLQTRNLVASNGLIHDVLLKELVEARMWMEDKI
jgi:myo-inositol-1(or 4)-monophosphatase